MEQYSREHGTNEQPGKQYFKATTLQDIINTAPIPQIKSSSSSSRSSGNEVEKGEMPYLNSGEGYVHLV
jgi:dual specificity protein kinase YAK1